MLFTGLRTTFAACLTIAAGERELPCAQDLPQSHLNRIEVHVEAGDWSKARAIVHEFASNRAVRSSDAWHNLSRKLACATSRNDQDPYQRRCRAEVSATLGLFDLALDYCQDRIRLAHSDQDAHHARMDTAEIARAAGLDAVRRGDYAAARRYYEMVAENGYSWVKQLGVKKAQLVAEFAKDPNNVAACITFAKDFWVGRTHGEGRHYVDAIALLERTLADSESIFVDQRKDIYMTVRGFCAMSHALSPVQAPEKDIYLTVGGICATDPAAARAWGDRILAEFPEDTDLIARIHVDRAEWAYAEKDLDSALQHYRHVCENLRGSASYGIAQFNVGMILKEQRRYTEAIGEFRKLLISRIDDHDPTGNIMAAYRNYRPMAQWEIGHCYRAMGRFREALNAYVDTEKKYPFQSWCENAHAEFAYRYALYQGLCHEHLGRHFAAAVYYWREVADGSGLYHDCAIHLRLLDLYESKGQVETLVNILDSIDDRHQKRVAKELGRPLDDEMREKIRPSATIREVMRIRSLGGRCQWQELITLCRATGTTAGPEEHYARKGNWRAVEAASALAQAPAETVPLLINAAGETQRPDIKWLYFALGRCGTEPALNFLEERAGVEKNIWPLRTIVFSLSVAGERGRQRLEELSLTAEGNLASAIRFWREGGFDERGEFEFPALPTTAELPDDLEAVSDPLHK